jgi:polyisoprenoid-binding protein YceI
MRISTPFLFVALGLALTAAACQNPAKDKPKAQVGEAKPEPAANPAPSGGPAAPPGAPPVNPPAAAAMTKFTIGPETSLIVLKGSKPSFTHTIKVPAFSGSIEMPAGKPLEGKLSVSIDMTKVEADDPKLTGHLQSPDFFETAKFPTATFTSTEIKEGGDKGASHTITGNFELRGVKKSIAFPATVALGADKASAKAEFVINRKDWGIVYPGKADDLIRDEVVITLDIDAPLAK